MSGSGKSSLVSQALVELVAAHLGTTGPVAEPTRTAGRRRAGRSWPPTRATRRPRRGWSAIKRLVQVDQKPIGRTPRSNLATYTGLFDHVRKLFAATPEARRRAVRRRTVLVQRRQGPLRDLRGRGLRDGGAAVPAQRLRALPHLPRRALQRQDPRGHLPRAGTSPTCWHDRGRRRASSSPTSRRVARALARAARGRASATCGSGQPATELSGGEAQRIKLATELQRSPARQHALRAGRADDRPAPGRRRAAHAPARTGWSTAGNTVIVVEHDMRVVAGGDWVIDIGPGRAARRAAGSSRPGPPAEVARSKESDRALPPRPATTRQQLSPPAHHWMGRRSIGRRQVTAPCGSDVAKLTAPMRR